MKNPNSLDSLLQQDRGTNFKGLKKRFAKVFILLAFSFSKVFFFFGRISELLSSGEAVFLLLFFFVCSTQTAPITIVASAKG